LLRAAHILFATTLLTALAALQGAGVARAQDGGAPAGTAVSNRATATFVDATGTPARLDSNVVTAIVSAEESLALAPDGAAVRSPGERFSFAHRLSNNGNVAFSATLSAANLGGDDGDALSLEATLDLDGDGRVDPGEPSIPEGGVVTVAAGGAVSIVLEGVVPSAALAGDLLRVELRATTAAQGRSSAATDEVTVGLGAAVSVAKSASTLAPARGGSVTFTLLATNNGFAAAAGAPVTIDGAPAVAFLVTDPIPAGAALVGIAAPPQGASALYHKAGDPPAVYVTTPPADLSTVDEAGAAFPPLAPQATMEVALTMRILETAGVRVENTAYARTRGPSGAVEAIASNTITLTLPGDPPVIRYYTSGDFSRVARIASITRPLFVEATARGCDIDATRVETRAITLRSTKTGDVESFVATETGPATGVFRIASGAPLRDVEGGASASPGNGTIETAADDQVEAEIDGCGTAGARAMIVIDPFGVFFDSATGAAISGVQITLVNVEGGAAGSAVLAGSVRSAATGGVASGAATGVPGAAAVFEVDQSTPAPSTLLTGADGRFRFPVVPPGRYRMVVTAPRGYRGPSSVPMSSLPAGRRIDATGSYLQEFTVAASLETIRFDIPLDPDSTGTAGGLFVRKTASVSEAEVGDFVDWTIETKNVGDLAVTATSVVDSLPIGHVYERGTARRAGARIADPQGGGGPVLVFEGGPLAPDQSVVITLRTRVGPGALRGDGVNRAQATAPATTPLTSNVATARVRLVEDIFTDRGFIFGKVFLDADLSRSQEPLGEPGVPGVRIFLEDGTWVVTDSEGKFMFYGVTPRTHVVKVDRTTLPQGALLHVIANRNMGDPGSRFADVKAGEMHRADFAIADPRGTAGPVIERRRAQATDPLAALTRAVDATFEARATSGAVEGDIRARPASGVIDAGATGSSAGAVSSAGSSASTITSTARLAPIAPVDAGGPGRSNLPSPRPPATPKVDLASLLPSLEPGLGFLDWKNGDVLPSAQVRVRVKGLAGAPFSLEVEGVPVPESRVGTRATDAARGIEVREYVGVALRPGPNALLLVQRDSFGNERGRAMLRVTAPGDLARLRLVTDRGEAPADGASEVAVRVFLEDKDGAAVTARTPATLEATRGTLLAPDLDPVTPGVQVFIEGGVLETALAAPGEPGEAALRVVSGPLEARAAVSFLPDLRPMLVTGLVEGKIALRNINTGAFRPTSREDAFERELRRFSEESSDGKLKAGARAAVFLKGKIPGDALLTAAYDSEKDTRERLFRDIQPDRFYPVYGDASVKGFDAQSTSTLYVRIDKDRHYLLYGDIATNDPADGARRLGAYDRSVTGGKAHFEEGPVTANVWATRDTLAQVVDEVRANGTSGFYQLSRTGFLENSEKVEVLTRDRNQPAVILRAAPMTRFADYELEVMTGRLLFRRPIPSVDENLNPISIRVTYEVDQGGDEFWVYGADGKVRVHERVEVGAAIARDENPTNRRQVLSANGAVEIAEGTTLVVEGAEARSESRGTGYAMRGELQHRSQDVEGRVFAARSTDDFENASSGMPGGRFETGAKGSVRVTDTTRLLAEGIFTEDAETHGRRYGALGGVEQALGEWVRAEVGFRWAHETADPASAETAATPGATPNDVYAARLKLSLILPFLPDAEVYAEGEQDLVDQDKHLLALGGSYRIDERTRVYARHELISTFGGPFSMNGAQSRNSTVVGVDSEYLKDAHAFTEYRARDAITGREAEAAIGLRNLWTVSERVRLHTSLEWLNPVKGDGSEETAAATGAVEYVNDPDWKGTARLELRYGEAADGLLTSAGLGWKVSRDWTLLSRALLSIDDGKGDRGNRVIGRAQAGAAWRQTDVNMWSALFRIEERYEDDRTSADAVRRRDVLLWSSHVNFQPVPAWVLSARVAGKALQDRSNGLSSESLAHLFQARTTVDLTDRFDLGFMGSALCSGDLSSIEWGLGAEVGARVFQNLWVTVGYNILGWRDRDLAGDEETDQGVYVGFRFKFDEDVLESFGS